MRIASLDIMFNSTIIPEIQSHVVSLELKFQHQLSEAFPSGPSNTYGPRVALKKEAALAAVQPQQAAPPASAHALPSRASGSASSATLTLQTQASLSAKQQQQQQMQTRTRVLLDARHSPFTLTRTLTRPRPGACSAELTEGAALLTPEQEYELALRTVHCAQRLWLMLLKRPSLQAIAFNYICKAPQQPPSMCKYYVCTTYVNTTYS